MLHDLLWLMIAAAAVCCVPLALLWDASFPPEEPSSPADVQTDVTNL